MKAAKPTPFQTAISKASQTSSQLLEDIKASYRVASPIQEIVVRQLLQQIVEIESMIKSLQEAINAKK